MLRALRRLFARRRDDTVAADARIASIRPLASGKVSIVLHLSPSAKAKAFGLKPGEPVDVSIRPTSRGGLF